MIPGNIQYAESEGAYVLKLIGEVRLTLGSSLELFLNTMLKNPRFHSVVVDLSETETIDSTSLGLLAKLSIRTNQQIDQLPVLICPKKDITRILTSMGFERIFVIVEDHDKLIDKLTMKEINSEDNNQESNHDRVLDAHRVLMHLNENNRKTFNDLVKQLEICRQTEPSYSLIHHLKTQRTRLVTQPDD